MSWRTVVVTKRAKLDLKMNHLVVRQTDSSVKIFLGEIAVLIIESTAVSLTTALLAALIENKTKVVFCDKKRNPSSELIPYYGSHDVSLKIENQINWNTDYKNIVWKEIIKQKITNQSILLKKADKIESKLLDKYVDEVEFGDL